MTNLDDMYDSDGKLRLPHNDPPLITPEVVRLYNKQVDAVVKTIGLVLRDMQKYPPESSHQIQIDGQRRSGWCLYRWETGMRIKVSLFAGCYLLSDGTLCVYGENETTRRIPLRRVSDPDEFSQNQTILSPQRMQHVFDILHEGTRTPAEIKGAGFGSLAYSIKRVKEFRRGRDDHPHLAELKRRRSLKESLRDLLRR